MTELSSWKAALTITLAVKCEERDEWIIWIKCSRAQIPSSCTYICAYIMLEKYYVAACCFELFMHDTK